MPQHLQYMPQHLQYILPRAFTNGASFALTPKCNIPKPYITPHRGITPNAHKAASGTTFLKGDKDNVLFSQLQKKGLKALHYSFQASE